MKTPLPLPLTRAAVDRLRKPFPDYHFMDDPDHYAEDVHRTSGFNAGLDAVIAMIPE